MSTTKKKEEDFTWNFTFLLLAAVVVSETRVDGRAGHINLIHVILIYAARSNHVLQTGPSETANIA